MTQAPTRPGREADVRTWPHLVRRFLGSLRPGGPGQADDAWAVGQLEPGEVLLWRRMSGADRRHHRSGGPGAERAGGVAGDAHGVAAALLHDVGKIASGFGPFRRSLATVAGMVAGRTAAERWRARPGLMGRTGRYLCHDAIGADLLAGAGSDGLTVAWAREHHLPAERWTVPADIAGALKAADDD